ncbi:MAG: hypothetical protein IJ632_05025 [Muribaculaceae bacterium]|nr:hypothetical protein [Muribaculaceae bacterium]
MKQKILTIVILLAAALAPACGWGAKVISTEADTMTVTDGTDTLRIVSNHLGELSDRIARALDDTVINRAAIDSTVANDVYSWPNNNIMELNRIWSRVAHQAINAFWIALAAIIFICLLFGYLRRQRKYRVIEKAIENNYPLAEGIFDNKPHSQTVYVQQPAPAPTPRPVAPPPAQAWARPANGPQAANAASGNAQPQPSAMPNASFPAGMPVNWRALWPAFKWIVAGLSGMLFFALAGGAWPMVGLCTIPLLIGLGKAFILYQDQVYVYQMTPYQPAPEEPTPADNEATPTPPEFNKPEQNA